MYTHMATRTVGFVFCLLLSGVLSATAATPGAKTYQDYPEWELLPKAIDCEDENYERAYQRLVDEGESRHEGLLAIVRECEDMQLARRALSILRLSNGDKRDVVAGLKEILAARLFTATGPEEWLMTIIADAVADMGDEADMEALVPMLSHPVLRVRIIGARCLGKRGGLHTREVLEQARSRGNYDSMLAEIDKAMSAIDARLAAQDAPQNAAPSP